MAEADDRRDPGSPVGARWCERLSATLAADAAQPHDLPPRLQGRLLRIARDVAHGTERSNAPLATFIAGRYVEARGLQGVSAEAALDEVEEAVRQLLGGATA